MNTQYSWLKGLGKGIVGAAVTGFGILAFVIMTASPELYNASIAQLISDQAVKLFGAMTVGGAFTFVINFLKVNSQ